MQQFLKRYNFLIYFLVYGLVFLPLPTWAKATGLKSKPASKQKSFYRVAVLELHNGKIKAQTVEKVTDTLRDEMSQHSKFQSISKEEISQFFVKHPELLYRLDLSNPLNRYIEEAKEFYKTSYFKEAVQVLENTIHTYQYAEPVMTQNFPLVEAYLMLGNIQLATKHAKTAKDAFKEAVRLDPDREINDLKYPPKTVSKFIKAKEQFLRKAKTAQLDVYSSPNKADVFVNGVAKGQTPLRLRGFPQGEHFILVKKEGYEAKANRVRLKSNYHRQKIDLKKASQKRNITTQGYEVKDLRNIPEQVRLASNLGKHLKADKVVWVSVEELGYNNKITARMIDMKYQASHKHKSVEVLDLPKDTRPAAGVIAKEMAQMADLDLSQNPKKYAESDVIVIGKKKKKSLAKNPILWSVLGVLIAGAATSAVLLTRGDGGGGDEIDNTSTVSVGASGPRNP